jgi:hypothetical protein
VRLHQRAHEIHLIDAGFEKELGEVRESAFA